MFLELELELEPNPALIEMGDQPSFAHEISQNSYRNIYIRDFDASGIVFHANCHQPAPLPRESRDDVLKPNQNAQFSAGTLRAFLTSMQVSLNDDVELEELSLP